MGILKRALKSVTRRKGKTLILFLIVFVLGNVIAASVSVKQSTTNLEKEIKEQMGSSSTIQGDYERVQADMEAGKLDPDTFDYSELVPTLETINAIGALPQVNSYNYSLNSYLYPKGFSDYVPEDGMMAGGGGMTVQGYAKDSLQVIKEGKISIVDGTELTQAQLSSDDKVAMISKQIADKNAINVGDEITLVSRIDKMMSNGGMMMGGASENEEEPYATQESNLKVVAIFEVHEAKKEDNKDKGVGMGEWRNFERMNTIFTPISFTEEQAKWMNETTLQMFVDEGQDFGGDTSVMYYEAKFILNDPNELDSFKKDASAYLHEYSSIIANSDAYDQIARPIQKLSSISNYVLIAGTAVSILILTLIVILFLRDRKHELGILLALGESKIKVFQQIFLEVFAVAIIAMTLSLFTGNVMAKQFSKGMISTNSDEMYMSGFYFNDSDLEVSDVTEQYSVVFSAQVILLYYGVGIATILLSTAGPMIYILRLQPKKILM